MNNAPGVFIETHGTLIFGSIKRITKVELNQIKIITYSLDSTLSNEDLELNIRCL